MHITRRFQWPAVSTHSRLKAAGIWRADVRGKRKVSTHSRLKAAGDSDIKQRLAALVSTHSRLKAAGAADSIRSSSSP